MKSHEQLHPLVLDQMYEHPERFHHMPKDEYIKLLIEDIRHYRARLDAVEKLANRFTDNNILRETILAAARGSIE